MIKTEKQLNHLFDLLEYPIKNKIWNFNIKKLLDITEPNFLICFNDLSFYTEKKSNFKYKKDIIDNCIKAGINKNNIKYIIDLD